MKTTATKILDAAENLFAEKGYKAASLGDVADRVGIRSPSLYNHFKNKEALYVAVLERLISRFHQPMQEMTRQPVSRARIVEWLDVIVDLHHRYPNLARLLQHAALAGGPQTREIIDRLFKPLTVHADQDPTDFSRTFGQALEPWAVVAFNNIVMSYITMAPMYRDILGMDPLCEEALARQRQLIHGLAQMVVGQEQLVE